MSTSGLSSAPPGVLRRVRRSRAILVNAALGDALIRNLTWAGVAAVAAAAVWFFAGGLFESPSPYVPIALVLGAFLALLVAALVRRTRRLPGLLAAAVELDQTAKTHSLLASSLEFASTDRCPFERWALDNAAREAERADLVMPKATPTARALPRIGTGAALLAVAVVAVLAIPPRSWTSGANATPVVTIDPAEVTAAQEVIDSARVEIAETADELGLEGEDEFFESLKAELEDGQREPDEAIASVAEKLDELADRAETEAERATESRDSISEQLAELEPEDMGAARDLAEALAEGDFQRAASEAGELNDRLADPEVRDDLRNLAEQLEQAAGPDDPNEPEAEPQSPDLRDLAGELRQQADAPPPPRAEEPQDTTPSEPTDPNEPTPSDPPPADPQPSQPPDPANPEREPAPEAQDQPADATPQPQDQPDQPNEQSPNQPTEQPQPGDQQQPQQQPQTGDQGEPQPDQPEPNPEQPGDQPQPTPEQGDQPGDQPQPEPTPGDQPNPDQPNPDQPNPDQPAPDRPGPGQPSPDQPRPQPGQPAPDQPGQPQPDPNAPDQPAPDSPDQPTPGAPPNPQPSDQPGDQPGTEPGMPSPDPDAQPTTLERLAQEQQRADELRQRADELRDRADRMLADDSEGSPTPGPMPGQQPAPPPADPWSGPTELVDARERSPEGDQRERVISEWFRDPEGRPIEAGTPADPSRVVRRAAEDADRAIEQQAVPKRHEDLIRRVFQRYAERAAEAADADDAE